MAPAKLQEQATKNVFPSVIETATFEGNSTRAVQHQHAAALVPQGPRAEAAGNLGPDDRQWPKGCRKPADPGPGRTLRGLHGLVQRADRKRRHRDPLRPRRRRPRTEADRRSAGSDRQARPLLGGRTGHSPPPTRTRARLGFEAGESAFMVNYTFAYAQRQGERARHPRSTWARRRSRGSTRTRPNRRSAASTSRVSSYSSHKQQAFEAAACLSGEKSELTAAELDGLPPSHENLYTNKVVREGLPGLRRPGQGIGRSGRARARPRPPTRTSPRRSSAPCTHRKDRPRRRRKVSTKN